MGARSHRANSLTTARPYCTACSSPARRVSPVSTCALVSPAKTGRQSVAYAKCGPTKNGNPTQTFLTGAIVFLDNYQITDATGGMLANNVPPEVQHLTSSPMRGAHRLAQWPYERVLRHGIPQVGDDVGLDPKRGGQEPV